MAVEESEEYYERRAQQELDLAAAATDRAVKIIHLDLAGRYATLRELAARAREDAAKASDESG